MRATLSRVGQSNLQKPTITKTSADPLPITVGIWGGKWVDGIMAREARKAGRIDSHGKLQYQPEDRMKENVWIAGIMFPAALVRARLTFCSSANTKRRQIVYGWTAQYGVNLAVPMIANFFFGIGSMLYVLSKASIKEPALTTYSIFAAVTTM